MSTVKDKLRKDIIFKFGSVTYFCKEAKISYRKFITFLNSKRANEEMQQNARHLCDTLKIDHIKGIIRDEDRRAIRICVLTNFDSYTDFCKANKQFDPVYLSNIIKGRLKEERDKYKLLVKILERDYGLELREEVTD